MVVTKKKFLLFSLLALLFLASSLISSQGEKAEMITRRKVIVAKRNEDVTLECKFRLEGYSSFDNPVLWIKQQLPDESVKTNLMGVMRHPFASTGRFEIVRHTNPPVYSINLKINKVTSGDMGDYTCELRGKKSSVLRSVTQQLTVIVPLDTLNIYGDVKTEGVSYKPSNSAISQDRNIDKNEEVINSSVINLVKGQHLTLKCQGQGGYPRPQLSFWMGDKNATNIFQVNELIERTGEVGLKTTKYKVSMWSAPIIVRSSHHAMKLGCEADIANATFTNRTSVIMLVQYAPEIECKVSFPFKEVKVICFIRARPEPLFVRWIKDTSDRNRFQRSNHNIIKLPIKTFSNMSFKPSTKTIEKHQVPIETYKINTEKTPEEDLGYVLLTSPKNDRNAKRIDKSDGHNNTYNGMKSENFLEYSKDVHQSVKILNVHLWEAILTFKNIRTFPFTKVKIYSENSVGQTEVVVSLENALEKTRIRLEDMKSVKRYPYKAISSARIIHFDYLYTLFFYFLCV